MNNAPIFFQFADHKAAYQAFDTLQELEFNVHWIEHDQPDPRPIIQIVMERNDLTSALEIAQSHGGVLLEEDHPGQEAEVFTAAYGLDQIQIPAHVVTEDMSERYMGDAGFAEGDEHNTTTEDPLFDPSEADYDHFPAGIRL
jgi:hypothetical protein